MVVATNLPVLDALGADKSVGEALDLARLAAQDHDLEAVVRVEMDVKRRQDRLVMGVLMLGELVAEVGDVVVVDQRDRADRLGLADAPLLLDERVANEVANRLRPVHVALLGGVCVETRQQTLVDRYAETHDFWHADHVPFLSCGHRGAADTARGVTRAWVRIRTNCPCTLREKRSSILGRIVARNRDSWHVRGVKGRGVTRHAYG